MSSQLTAIPLVDELVRHIEGRAGAGVFSPDATGEFHFPGQDFAMHGAKALDDLLNQARPAGATVHAVAALPTPDGFVVEIRYQTHHDHSTYQTASIVSVRDGRIHRLVHYCTGHI
jgi:ketosteroid isomerase-like protein